MNKKCKGIAKQKEILVCRAKFLYRDSIDTPPKLGRCFVVANLDNLFFADVPLKEVADFLVNGKRFSASEPWYKKGQEPKMIYEPPMSMEQITIVADGYWGRKPIINELYLLYPLGRRSARQLERELAKIV